MCLVCGGTQQARHEQQTLTAAIAKLDGSALTVVDPVVPRVLTARPLSDFVLDQHLPTPAEWRAATSLFEPSVINQAIGALIGRGYTLKQAERHLTAEGADAGISRHAVGLRLLVGLSAR